MWVNSEKNAVYSEYTAPEKCDVASTIYYGLYALQHRGQESCGIVVNDDGVFNCVKDSGLVNETFSLSTDSLLSAKEKLQ